jgi:hypothetical protein
MWRRVLLPTGGQAGEYLSQCYHIVVGPTDDNTDNRAHRQMAVSETGNNGVMTQRLCLMPTASGWQLLMT